MTDLTEQWKKGELPNGYYWIRLSWGGMVIMAYHTAFDGLFELDDHYYDSDEISEVLAPVPSYDEWEQLQNWADFTDDYHELREKLEIAEYENAELKELLKECELWFTGMVGNMNDKNVGEHNKSVPIGNFEYIFKVFSQKINEVLK